MPKPFTKRYNEFYNGTLNHHIRGMSKKDMELFKVIKRAFGKNKKDCDIQKLLLHTFYMKNRAILKEEFAKLQTRPFERK